MKGEFILKGRKNFAELLVSWYNIHKRDLPWRETTDPYVIWLSEIILQQTRVQQGLPYFRKFVAAYPTIADFARAEEKDILRLWQGLGYYSRARNMMTCAKIVMEEHGGKFPESHQELLKLKGIGKYTAAAMASFSHNERVPVIDGNVYRVLSRIFGVDHDISRSDAYRKFESISADLMEEAEPALYNQAIMEFGATHCVPRSPNCGDCPFTEGCFARANELQAVLPVKTKKIKKRQRYLYYFVIRHKEDVLLHHRTKKDIWSGLYDFFHLEFDSPQNLDDLFQKEGKFLAESGTLSVYPKEHKHILTHQIIHASFFLVEVGHKNTFDTIKDKFELIRASIKELDEFPNPVLIDKFLKSDFL